MHCIQFRPSARFFQFAQVASSPIADGGTRGPDVQGTPNIGTATRTTAWFQTKDERLAHVDELKSVVVHVIISKDVVAHLSGGDPSSILPDVLSTYFSPQAHPQQPSAPLAGVAPPSTVHESASDLSFVLSVPSTSNVSHTIATVFETWMELRERTGLSPRLHQQSLYRKIAEDGIGMPPLRDLALVDAEVASLALLQSDLCLGICDASGRLVQPLKRVFVPKGGVTNVPAPDRGDGARFPPQASVTWTAQAMLQHRCQLNGLSVSQKQLINILSTFVEPTPDGQFGATSQGRKGQRPVGVQVVSPQRGEAAFQPPFLLKLYIPDDCKHLRRLMLQESIYRERIVADMFRFTSNFAVPYFRECLTHDTSLRVDWILYQSRCRHRIHIMEREQRMRCEQGVVNREASEERDRIIEQEAQARMHVLGHTFERMMFVACWIASRAEMVADRESQNFANLRGLYQRDTSNLIHLLETRSLMLHFTTTAGFEMEEQTRREMLSFFHASVTAIRARPTKSDRHGDE